MRIHPRENTPVFSVILPTRDRAAMLRRAVSSVLHQSFQNFELIVIDDGSAQCYLADLPEDSRIRIIRNSVSWGVAQARNMGIDAARGTYIAFLDDDDEYLSSFLSRTYATLKKTPEQIGISWCGAKYIHYPSDVDSAPIVRVRKFGPHANRQALLADFLSIGTGQGVTIKAACLEKVGPFNPALKVASDSDMFFRMLEQGFLPVAVRGVHIVRHDHCGSRLTGAALYPERIRAWEELLLRHHSQFLDEYPTIRNNLRGYVESLKQNLGNGGNHRHGCYASGTRDNWLLSLFTMLRDRLTRIERLGRTRKLTETNRSET